MKTKEHFSIATTVLSYPCLNELFLNAKNEMIKVREQLAEANESGNQMIEPDRHRGYAAPTLSKEYHLAR
jgi:hypothetical protein